MYVHALQGPPFFPQRVMPAAAAALIAACLRRDAAARPLASAVWEWDFFGAGSFLRGEALLREAVLARTAPPPFFFPPFFLARASGDWTRAVDGV